MGNTGKKQDEYKNTSPNSSVRRGGNDEMLEYSKKVTQTTFDTGEITFISTTPQYDTKEKENIHTEIERGLYNVFSKYI